MRLAAAWAESVVDFRALERVWEALGLSDVGLDTGCGLRWGHGVVSKAGAPL